MEPRWITRLLLLSTQLSDHSRHLYVLAFKYFAAWYQLRYDGEPFPLARDPPCPMDDASIAAFVGDQLPLIRGGHVIPAMPSEVRRGLRDLGYFRNDRCPSEATSIWRLKVLHLCQCRSGTYPGEWAIRQGQERVRAEWKQVNATLRNRQLAGPSFEIVRQLLGACDDSRDVARNRALVTLMLILTTNQLAQLQIGDLSVGEMQLGDELVLVLDVTICNPANEFQRQVPRRRLFGRDAEAVALWRKCRLQDAMGAGVKGPEPNLPYFVRNTKAKGFTTVTRGWVLKTFHDIATAAGLITADRRCHPSMIRLLSEFESDVPRF